MKTVERTEKTYYKIVVDDWDKKQEPFCVRFEVVVTPKTIRLKTKEARRYFSFRTYFGPHDIKNGGWAETESAAWERYRDRCLERAQSLREDVEIYEQRAAFAVGKLSEVA